MINGTAVEKLLDAMEKLEDAYRDMLNAAMLADSKVKIADDDKNYQGEKNNEQDRRKYSQ